MYLTKLTGYASFVHVNILFVTMAKQMALEVYEVADMAQNH